jgi:hypothetical protein
VALFEVQRESRLPASQAWSRLTDWRRHGEFIPFTEILVTSAGEASGRGGGGQGVGASFVARTVVGPWHFDDPMEVTYWQPPDGVRGVCRLVKTGNVVTGWAVLTVSPTATGCSITWKEDAAVRFTGALLGRPTKILATRVFGHLVDKLLEGSAEDA